MKRRHFLRAAGILPLGAAAVFLAGREKLIEGVFPAQDVDPESRSVSTLERQHKTPAHATHLVPGSDEPDEARSKLSPSLDKLVDALDFSAVYYVCATGPGHTPDRIKPTHSPVSVVRIGVNLFLTSRMWEPYIVSSKAPVEVTEDGNIMITSLDHLGHGASRCHLWPETYEDTLARLNEKHNSVAPRFVGVLARNEKVRQIDLAEWFEKLQTRCPVIMKPTEGDQYMARSLGEPYPMEYRPWCGPTVDGHRRSAVVDIHPAGRPYPADKPLPRFIHPPTTPKIVADAVVRGPDYNKFAEPGLMSHQTAMIKMRQYEEDYQTLDRIDRHRKAEGLTKFMEIGPDIFHKETS